MPSIVKWQAPISQHNLIVAFFGRVTFSNLAKSNRKGAPQVEKFLGLSG